MRVRRCRVAACVLVAALALAAAARRAFARGLLHGYLTHEEALPTVRGRIRFDDQLRHRHSYVKAKQVIPLARSCLMVRKMLRAKWRFSARTASRRLLPSPIRRAT